MSRNPNCDCPLEFVVSSYSHVRLFKYCKDGHSCRTRSQSCNHESSPQHCVRPSNDVSSTSYSQKDTNHRLSYSSLSSFRDAYTGMVFCGHTRRITRTTLPRRIHSRYWRTTRIRRLHIPGNRPCVRPRVWRKRWHWLGGPTYGSRMAKTNCFRMSQGWRRSFCIPLEAVLRNRAMGANTKWSRGPRQIHRGCRR